jgi:hypothetical protein
MRIMGLNYYIIQVMFQQLSFIFVIYAEEGSVIALIKKNNLT